MYALPIPIPTRTRRTMTFWNIDLTSVPITQIGFLDSIRRSLPHATSQFNIGMGIGYFWVEGDRDTTYYTKI
jgi:hypothetical protein